MATVGNYSNTRQQADFEATYEMLEGICFAANLAKDWSEFSFEQFNDHSGMKVNFATFLTLRKRHRERYNALKKLGDGIAKCLGVQGDWLDADIGE